MQATLTNILNYANHMGNDQPNSTKLYINDRGAISNTSGLSAFKQHFSAKERKAENRATLEAFHTSIAGSQQYAMHKDNPEVTDFFQRKREEGTPLTAGEVKNLQGVMDGTLREMPREIKDDPRSREWNPLLFGMYCAHVGYDMKDPEQRTMALKNYFSAFHMESSLKNLLHEAGIPHRDVPAALKLLQSSGAWQKALNKTFSGNIDNLTLTELLANLHGNLEKPVALLVKIYAEKGMDKALKNPSDQHAHTFDATLKALEDQAITENEGALFAKACISEGWPMNTPASVSTSVMKFYIITDTKKMFTDLAETHGLPPKACEALSQNPEFKSRAEAALRKAFPPPVLPNREAADKILNDIVKAFLAEKAEDVRKLLALVDTVPNMDNALKKILTPLDANGVPTPLTQDTICILLNPLLKGQALMDKMLDANAPPDTELLKLLMEFQDALAAAAPMLNQEAGLTTVNVLPKTLALLLGARNANAEQLSTFLDAIRTKFQALGPGLGTLKTRLDAGTLPSKDSAHASAAIQQTTNAIEHIADFALSVTTKEQQESLQIFVANDAFKKSLRPKEDNNVQPEGEDQAKDIHRAVRYFGIYVGIEIPEVPYGENKNVINAEMSTLFSTVNGKPQLTQQGQNLVTNLARELQVNAVDVQKLSPADLKKLIQGSMTQVQDRTLSADEAKQLYSKALRDHLKALKSALDHVAQLPTVADPNNPQAFVITPKEKASLLRTLPSTNIRSPELIQALIVERRAMQESMKKDMVPNMSQEDALRALQNLYKIHKHNIDIYAKGSTTTEQVPDVLKVALGMAFDDAQIDPDVAKDVLKLLNGPAGVELGRSCTSLAGVAQSMQTDKAAKEAEQMFGTVEVLKNMIPALASYTNTAVNIAPLQYQNPLSLSAIPAPILEHAWVEEKPFFVLVEQSLSAVTPKLTEKQKETLRPILAMAETLEAQKHNQQTILRMLTANAQELLAATARNKGKELSRKAVWKVIFGAKPSVSLHGKSFADEFYRHACKLLTEYQQAQHGGENNANQDNGQLNTILSMGVPFKKLREMHRPNASISLQDLRLEQPHMPTLAGYQPDNAFGLAANQQQRNAKAPDHPSTTTIHVGNDNTSVAYNDLIKEANIPDSATFTTFTDRISGLCKGKNKKDAQFLRVMQCLSNTGPRQFQALSKALPQYPFPEGSYIQCSVKAEGDNVVIEYANDADSKPWGASMRIVVAANGTTTIGQMEMTFRG